VATNAPASSDFDCFDSDFIRFAARDRQTRQSNRDMAIVNREFK
jgi:hypothetical protein